MSFEADFRDLLINYLPIQERVGTRVVWSELPPARPMPQLSLWNITRDTPPTMDQRTGYAASFVQINCWGERYADASALADEVTGYLQSLLDAVDTGGTRIQGAFPNGRRDSNQPTLGAPAARYFCVQLDVIVHWDANEAYLVGDEEAEVVGVTVP